MVCSLSVLSNSVTPWTIACWAPLCMEFSRQEYWSGLPFPTPGDLPNPETEPVSPASAGQFFTTEPPGKPCYKANCMVKKEKKKPGYGEGKGWGDKKPHRQVQGDGLKEVQEESVAGKGPSNVLWGFKESLPSGISVTSEAGQKLENGSHISIPMPSPLPSSTTDLPCS